MEFLEGQGDEHPKEEGVSSSSSNFSVPQKTGTRSVIILAYFEKNVVILGPRGAICGVAPARKGGIRLGFGVTKSSPKGPVTFMKI